VKLTKNKLKEWIKEDLLELYSEAEDDEKKEPESPAGGEGDKPTSTALKINIPENPFDGVEEPNKAQTSQLKELVKKKLKELQFKSPEAYERYKQKHNIKKTTKVDVGGKETTAGELDKKLGLDKIPFDAPYTTGDDDMDAGGPAYANVPKGAKSSKDAIGMKKAQDLAKSSIPRSDKETGNHLDQMAGDDEDSMDDLMNQLDDEPEVNTLGKDDPETGDDLSPQNIDKYNSLAARGKPVMVDTDAHGPLSWEEGDPQSGVMIGLDQDGDEVEVSFDDIVRVNEVNESMREGGEGSGPKKGGKKKSKGLGDFFADKVKKNIDKYNKRAKQGKRRTTVKEVKKWMKGLEENRYKKTYMADCRRVSWLVNNKLSEDYETMPKSMKKKWPKAAYKRERFLAKEFVKHLMTKQMNEQKIRKFIKDKLLEQSLRIEIRKILKENKRLN